ncbi:MAG: efflux RND transporter periplasmic adaptor subunit [Phycisphaerales bacterium]|nr:MAG: efflux RND transporter periplasmic adaptor subunit [Phycisphaerales bacterium]
MKILRRIVYWVAALSALCITYWYAYRPKPPAPAQEEKSVPVEVLTVGTDSIEHTIEATGWIAARQVVGVASKVGGRVESLQVVLEEGNGVPLEEGLAIKKGQRLAVIDHDVYLAQLAAAEAAVKAGEIELKDAERERERILGLFEGGSVTEQNRDKAMTAAELAAASLNLAKANLELAKINLQESTIVSPIDGVITAKHIDQGNLVRIGDRIATVADMQTVKIVVPLSERYAADVRPGTPVRVRVDAFGSGQLDAAVYSVYPALDEQTHTVQVEIRIENNRHLLKPGMFARVEFITERKDDIVVVPRDVVLGGKIDRHYVYVVEETGGRSVGRKRFVEIGIVQGERCQIADGLEKGETLVVNGMNFLADGTAVEIVRLEDIK